ncbi:hypothetical protein OG462_40785 [Streptomyces sp. NBC_01077]|uniref:hypothetical protein n=1 Tax=Streptomyces sp. NBC_01077 TaxID=2903746 RepID=UPI003870686D|nr:hypothetical protein OG462_40785 [Streptomyces sp. NBC_01077]
MASVALAVTARTALTAAPAPAPAIPAVPLAASAPAVSAQAAQEAVAPLAVPADSVIVSAGRTGISPVPARTAVPPTGGGATVDGATTVLPVWSYQGGPGLGIIVPQARVPRET